MRQLILILGLLVSTCSAQVTYEAAGTITNYFGTSPATGTITLGGASASRAVAVALLFDSAGPPGIAVTVGGSSASLVASAHGGTYPFVAIYCLPTSLTGLQTISVSWTGGGSTDVGGGAISATGVNQSTPCINGNFDSGGSSPQSLTITSSSGDLTFTMGANGTNNTMSTNQTVKWGPSDGDSYYAYGDIGPGTGTTTHTWTSASSVVRIVGADFESGTVTVATPTFGTANGTFISNPSTTITTATGGSTICYNVCNTSGCTPTNPAASTPGTCSNGTTLSNGGSVTITGKYETIAALGTQSGDVNSAIASSGQYLTTQIVATINGLTVGNASGDISSVGGIAFGFRGGTRNTLGPLNAPTASVDVILDWAGLSNATAPTSGTLNSSWHSANLCNSWTINNSDTNVTGATAAHLSNYVTQGYEGGALYTGASGLGLQIVTQTAGNGQVLCVLTTTSHKAVSIGKWVEWTVPDTDTSTNVYPLDVMTDTSNIYYVDWDIAPQGAGGTYSCVALEVKNNGDTGCIQAQANTIYWLTMLYNSTGCSASCAAQKLALYSVNANGILSQVGSTITVTPAGADTWSASNGVEFIGAGFSGGEGGTAGYDIYNGPEKVSFSGTFPLLP